MRPSIISKLLALAPLSILGTVACTEPEPEPTPPTPPPATAHVFSPAARFADLTEAQRTRAVIAASGADAEEAIQRASRFTGLAGGLPCPAIERSAGQIAVTTDCRIGDIEYRGGFVARYPGGNAAVELTFEDFAVIEGGATVAIDGVVSSVAGRIDSKLTTTRDGLPVYAQASWQVEDQAYTALPDARIDLFALGSATVEGSWKLERLEREGAVELQGVDLLIGDVGPSCFALTIGDQPAGQACAPLLAPR